MLDTRTRKQIEWHFYNYKADLIFYKQEEQDIIDRNLTAEIDHVGGRSCACSQTERKVMQIDALNQILNCRRDWATVVRFTFNKFMREPQFKVMTALYIKNKSKKQIMKEFFMHESTFYRWRDSWIEYALKWAEEFELI